MPCPAIAAFFTAASLLTASAIAAAPTTSTAPSTAPATAASTRSIVIKIVAEQLGITPGSVKPESKLKDFGADDLDIVELIMELEDEFNVSIPDEALPKDPLTLTVADLIKITDSARAGAASKPATRPAARPAPSH